MYLGETLNSLIKELKYSIKSPCLNCISDKLTAILKLSYPSDNKYFTLINTSLNTNFPIGIISLVFSAIGINSPGLTNPISLLFHLSNASNPLTSSSVSLTLG
ncbi:hypothetical protein SDC9_60173 [bioreactor metagenome]|uniref:Uncharacterized protein n=1 Tax=bioreactor metagenome TaxID=1076179 RepID=A0A644XI00_9ZZZZ